MPPFLSPTLVLVPEVDVNLKIYDGQGAALPVPWYSEVLRGAFTVANMNDTDGDGVADNVDVDGVLFGDNGVNEVDLMRLDLSRPYPGFAGKVTLTVPSSRIVLWREETKVTRIPMDDFGVAEFGVSDYPAKGDLKIWAEAVSPSTAVRDMSIVMSYGGLSDTVLATAVWATLTASETSTLDAETVLNEFPDMDTKTTACLNRVGGTGLRPLSETRGAENAIVMQFTVQPAGIEDESPVLFDVARRAEAGRWYWKNGVVLFGGVRRDYPKDHVPGDADSANDDPDEEDESPKPNTLCHMYSFDSPGWPRSYFPGTQFDRVRYVLNAWEYVRVGIGNDPTGNTLDGSRASDFYGWASTIMLEDDGAGNTVRTTGDWGENDIALPRYYPLE